jgi:DNA (cytosine-5)-methyltransferase 1
LRGIKDKRGQLFYDFIRILEAKQPKFFLAENVSGMLIGRHSDALENIKKMLAKAGTGYDLSFKLLNVRDYSVPQDRKRVIFVGIRKDLGVTYRFPKPHEKKIDLQSSIGDLVDSAVPAIGKNHANPNCKVLNHEYMTGDFSSMYMSRNRVRAWDEQSFTIQAGGRHAPLHPQAPKMELVKADVRKFIEGKEHLYRRLSVRECARIQTFPDEFEFIYNRIAAGYKMIGNAVPVQFAEVLARSIMTQIEQGKCESSERKHLSLL